MRPSITIPGINYLRNHPHATKSEPLKNFFPSITVSIFIDALELCEKVIFSLVPLTDLMKDRIKLRLFGPPDDLEHQATADLSSISKFMGRCLKSLSFMEIWMALWTANTLTYEESMRGEGQEKTHRILAASLRRIPPIDKPGLRGFALAPMNHVRLPVSSTLCLGVEDTLGGIFIGLGELPDHLKHLGFLITSSAE